jgi:hypothetical protein
MRTDKIMYDILEKLDGKGFVLYYLKAFSTSSCYIKLDFGVCKSIRIADHKGIEKYKYTFNLMIGLDKSYVEDGRYYYCLEDLDKMIKDIIKYRDDLQKVYGFKYFETMLEYKKQFLRKRKGFWEKAKSYND